MDYMKLLLAWDIRGSRAFSRLLCFLFHKLEADAIVLMGDIASPTLIQWLSEACGAQLLGITGALDNASVIKSLGDKGILMDGRVVEFRGVRLAGLGIASGAGRFQGPRAGGALILFSYLRGREWGCGGSPGIKSVDVIASALGARLLAFSKGGPCGDSRSFSPGSARLGYMGEVLVEGGRISWRYFNICYDVGGI